MLFHLMKTYIRNPETETKLFLCTSTSSDTDGCAADTNTYIPRFFEFGINGNLERELLEMLRWAEEQEELARC